MEGIPVIQETIVEHGGLSALLAILQPTHPLHRGNSQPVFDAASKLSSHSRFDFHATRAGVIGMVHVISKRRQSMAMEATRGSLLEPEHEMQVDKYAETMCKVIRRHSAAITLQAQARRFLVQTNKGQRRNSDHNYL